MRLLYVTFGVYKVN